MTHEANLVAAYRAARRDFIAACEGAGADAIARVHPARGPDGKPLFCDSAAFGPRDAGRGLLVIGAPPGLLAQGLKLPAGARLVLVHAPDPYQQAWGKKGAPWPQKTLAAIAAEDLSRVKKLTVVDAEGLGVGLALPGVKITFQPASTEAEIWAAIAAL